MKRIKRINPPVYRMIPSDAQIAAAYGLTASDVKRLRRKVARKLKLV